MSEKIPLTLEGDSQTLLMTLYARARESQRPDALIRDELAVSMVQQFDCDFSRFRLQRHDEIAIILRMSQIDSQVRDFLKRNSQAAVVHIGCGLDTRFERVDDGRVEWLDLDLPEVIALRQKLIHNPNSRYHMLATDVCEAGWMVEASRFLPRAFLFIAEGVLPYLTEPQVKALFLKLRDHFPGCELVCDAQTPFIIWANNLQLAIGNMKARLHWGLKNGREVERWGEGIRLMDEWFFLEQTDTPLKALRWMRLIPGLARSTGIFHYRLG